jgi:hypothetical protein
VENAEFSSNSIELLSVFKFTKRGLIKIKTNNVTKIEKVIKKNLIFEKSFFISFCCCI